MSAVELHLPENLTISKAHALHDEFEALLNAETAEEIVVYADKVSRADTAGLQLMLAVVKLGKERQMGMVWTKPSDTLIDVAHALGLKEALGLH